MNTSNQFNRINNEIYKLVFEKISKLLPKEIKHIEILPNALLSNLSFEILLDSNSKSNDFRKLPYLINKYNFSYSLSSSINKINSINNEKNNNKTAILSPFFNGKTLSKLEFSKNKSKEIATKFNATFFDNKKATLQNFELALKNTHVVSVFSHGQSFDNLENNQKGIYFSDGFLKLNDIYKLKSNCDFLVLGACETGLGYKDNGEGNIGLSRAFTSIGVKSMLLASWKIDEESTMIITESFLDYLQSGFSKSEALQKAKLDFIKTSNPRNSNPYYWAGLYVVGNNENVKPQQTKNYLWWLVLIFPLVGGIWYYRKSNKKFLSK